MFSESGIFTSGIIHFVAFVWVAYDVWNNNTRLRKPTKIIWTTAALFFSILTAIVYYFMEKRK